MTPRRAYRRLGWTVAGAAALGSLLLFAQGRRSDGMGALVDAAKALSSRAAAGRLSGGFAYRRLEDARRSAVSPAPAMHLAAAAAERAAIFQRRPSIGAARAWGVAALLAGEPGVAVSAFEEAVRLDASEPDLATAVRRSENADLLSDLAAAYLARAQEGGLDELAARDAVERAWGIAQTPEIAWNRALAHSGTSLREAALAAWRDCLGREPAGPWAAEARQRTADVSSRGLASREQVRDALSQSLSIGGEEQVLRAVSLGPGHARAIVEEELLPSWAAGDDGALDRARRVAGAVSRISGDALAADSVEQVRRARQDAELRDALVGFGKGRAAMQAYGLGEARSRLASAERTLRRRSVVLAERSALYLATLEFYEKRPDASLAGCEAVLRRDVSGRYPSLEAQCAWNEGAVETARRRFDRARSAFQRARALFERMRDAASAASIEVRIEENYRWAGEVESAWAAMRNALHAGASDRDFVVMREAGRVAEAAGLPFAALSFYAEALEAATRAASAVELTNGHLSRARLWLRLERPDEARRELNAASRSFAGITDQAAGARLRPSIAISRGALLADAQPDRVLAEVDEAIADLSAAGTRVHLALAHEIAARAHRAKGDSAAAERSLGAALGEIERQREEITTDEERMTLLDTGRRAAEELVALLIDAGRSEEALRAVERYKARLLRDALMVGRRDAPEPLDVTPRPGPEEAYLEYFSLEDRLLIWTITARATRLRQVPVARVGLARTVDAVRAAAAGEDDVHSRTAPVFDVVLAPVWADVSACRRWVIAADDALHRLSFPLLESPGSGRFLAEDRYLSVVPSLTWLAERERTAGRGEPLRRGVAIVPSAGSGSTGDRYARLDAAERDARTVSSGFPLTVVLSKDQATVTQLAAAAQSADFIHFAGHAVVDERRPSRSALVLGGGALLRSSEIATWRLSRPRLITLAACSTAIGRPTSDGTASLARAFLLAGSPTVVATLWPVRDSEASRWSARFYAELARGRSVPDAFRAAQTALIRESTENHHYDWAAFQLLGL